MAEKKSLRGTIKNIMVPERGRMMTVPSIFGERKAPTNFLREKGVVSSDFNKINIDSNGLVSNAIPFDSLDLTYARVPKVFRAINMRSEFAVQSGFKLLGEDEDVDNLKKWLSNIHIDNILIPIGKGMLKSGNVFIEMLGDGQATRLNFLPPKEMRVKRGVVEKNGSKFFTSEVVGYAQVSDAGTVINEWKPEDIIHFKWNWDGVNAYGLGEIQPAIRDISDKLDVEAVIPKILKFHADARIIYNCGRPETPYNKLQMNEFVGDLEERVVGGDAVLPGDITATIVQPRSNPEIINLLDHIEQQIDLSLNSPATLFFTGGDGQFSMTVMDAIERDVKTIQDVMFTPIEKQVFPRVLGKTEVPIIKPNPMNVETFLRLSRTFRQLVGKKSERLILTPDEARAELGYGEIDQEMVKQISDMENGGNDEPREETESESDDGNR